MRNDKAAGMSNRRLRVMGTRGVPAAHGGFETFAEKLALYLVSRGWPVTVYCQRDGDGPVTVDQWQGIERVNIPVAQAGPLGTIVFDWRATAHAAQHPQDLVLTLGYNTAVFCARLRWAGVRNVINMDGIEWRRGKWGPLAKAWFWLNERAGCWLGQHLVADHPAIAQHLATRVRASKITMIPYGADAPAPGGEALLARWSLRPGQFLTVVARAEPENSVLEIVRGFSARPRGLQLLVLGHYDPQHPYQGQVLQAAGSEVVFAGAVYDKPVVGALRRHCLAYVHGHQVGGTNPSLLEALAAGNPVLAHDNPFNRWVAGDASLYFADAADFDVALTGLLQDRSRLAAMQACSLARFEAEFRWASVLPAYEALLAGA
jgi:glycosyltransferase involved in cell wall biosynthesis